MAASEKHLELANVIKKVHDNLRALARTVGPEEAWEIHKKEHSNILKEYADAMHSLATNYWDINNRNDSSLCRLQWVANQCLEYFYKGGQEKEILKETDLLVKHLIPMPSNTEYLLKQDKVRLLDIGSCYNPFKRFDWMDVVAVDLEPAIEEVVKCDFLKVKIGLLEAPEQGCFEAESFDVAVLSFVLEYLPSPEQRFTIVCNATAILKASGLLFILTPDSGHQSARSKLMRQWRVCLASLGLTRIAYEKLPHLHCMAFRRCLQPEIAKRWHQHNVPSGIDPKEMLSIPQDNKLVLLEDSAQPITKESVNVENISACFEELPFS